MAGRTKMIIITSDEEIIRQFTVNKGTNTQIIDLNNSNQLTSTTTNNNNILNLDFLGQLSELNSDNDQVYKRALDSPDHNRSKSAKVSKKSPEMICAICGDRAVGYNYDVLSCATCKIFFHRNAHLDLETIRCLTGQGQCSVERGIRRRCKRCRLDRCFSMGMKKEFILSEEEKQRRKKRLEENRNNSSTSTTNVLSNSESILHTSEEIDRILMDENRDLNQMKDPSLEILSVEDCITIESVRSTFLSFFENDYEECSCVDVSDRASALISWSQFVHKVALRFINFFRQINEFEDLDLDDRFILIKYNIFPLLIISKCFHSNPINDCCLNGDNEEAVKNRRFYMLCGASNDIRDMFVSLVLSLVEITKQDPRLLSFLSIILIFVRGLSMNENEPSLKDSLAVNRTQSHYIKILWNYLVNQWGEKQACRHFTQDYIWYSISI